MLPRLCVLRRSLAHCRAIRIPLSQSVPRGNRFSATAARNYADRSNKLPSCKRFSTIAGEDRNKKLIHWFEDLNINDVGIVGGKNASLGEMYSNLTSKGVVVPNGFAISAYAYHDYLKSTGLDKRIREMMKDLNVNNLDELAKVGNEVRSAIIATPLPKKLEEAICEAYTVLEKEYGEGVDTAVRSSATAEDLPDASFAGQQETFLNVRGTHSLLDSCRRCFASLFTNRAITYRELNGYSHFSVGLSIGVQKMVRSDEAASGVMFSLDTETGFKDVVLVNGAWGLGENVVQGAVNPDEWYVFKPTLKQGKRSIINKHVGKKQFRMIYASKGDSKLTRNIETAPELRNKFCCTDDEILTLARWAAIIEDHYSTQRGKYTPMDMEWAKDASGRLFIVQARPETVHSQKAGLNKVSNFVLNSKPAVKPLCVGTAVGSRIGNGEANVIRDPSTINEFKKGQVLVTEMTDPDWVPAMKIASAIVTNRGGRTCHAAIISREMGIPCIVGTGDATLKIRTGDKITVDASRGEKGVVWPGLLPFHKDDVDVGSLPATKTKIMMNLANPTQAFGQSFLPNSGVGLARMEFIVNEHIKVHPLACLKPERLNEEEISQLNELTHGYSNPKQYFIHRLAQGVGMLAAAFYPKKVILRFSDFKTNEYAHLLGGHYFEPKEENPMIGWRGASRYYDDDYKEGFALECEAVKKVRSEFGLTNLEVMVPFCRTVEEGQKVLAEMARNGLKRGEDGLRVICMCEIPSNVILAEEFLEIFDGFSIGSNDLTQLTLGVDRDSEKVAHVYNEHNLAIKRLISRVIEVAKRKNKYIGICGQAPSDFPDFAEYLVGEGIESMSLNPDTIVKTTLLVAAKEKAADKTQRN